ncbi:MAG TPA: type II secretion system F family protein, partial [Allocoleopsis sp.]
MPTYIASARDARGNAKKQKITANSPGEARSTLREQGFVVQDLKEDKSFDLSSIDLKKFELALTSVTVKDKAVFSRQFAALVNAGVAMVRSLGVLSEQCTNPKLKASLLEINSDVQQ